MLLRENGRGPYWPVPPVTLMMALTGCIMYLPLPVCLSDLSPSKSSVIVVVAPGSIVNCRFRWIVPDGTVASENVPSG